MNKPTATLCLVDCETTGLSYQKDQAWEVAALRVKITGSDLTIVSGLRANLPLSVSAMARVEHLPEKFRSDFHARWQPPLGRKQMNHIARLIQHVTAAPSLVGANVAFDVEFLTKYLHQYSLEPRWGYKHICVETLILGHACDVTEPAELLTAQNGETFSSTALSRQVGIEPDNYVRHTAVGDVDWELSQLAAVWDLKVDDSKGILAALRRDREGSLYHLYASSEDEGPSHGDDDEAHEEAHA